MGAGPAACSHWARALGCLGLGVPVYTVGAAGGRTQRPWENGGRPGAPGGLPELASLGPACLHSDREKEEVTVRKKEEEEGEDDWGLELEELEEPGSQERAASSST